MHRSNTAPGCTRWYGYYPQEDGSVILSEHITRDHAHQSKRFGKRPTFVVRCTPKHTPPGKARVGQKVLVTMLAFGDHGLTVRDMAGHIMIQSGAHIRDVPSLDSINAAISGMTVNNRTRKFMCYDVNVPPSNLRPRHFDHTHDGRIWRLTPAGRFQARALLRDMQFGIIEWPGFTPDRIAAMIEARDTGERRT